jgi:hypothetical protein
MAYSIFFLFSGVLLLELRTFEDRVRVLDPICEYCRYSLRGLPNEGRCPECGESYDPYRRVRQVERLAFRRGVLWYWLFALAAMLVFELTDAGTRLYAHDIIQSYRDDGYSLEVATNAAFKRELGQGRAFVGQWVGAWWFGVSPLLGRMFQGRTRCAVLVGGGVVVLFLIRVSGLGV